MDLKQLKAFLTIAETGNVTRAAETLHLVQPAVSRQLQLLEEGLGVKLFERERHGMVLTARGQSLQVYAQRVMLELEKARAEVTQKDEAIGGIVTLGLLPSTVESLSVPLVRAIATSFPGIQLRISMGYAGTLQRWVESGEVDAALVYGAEKSTAVISRPLVDEALWVIAPASAGLKRKRPIKLSGLTRQAVILPSRPHGIRALLDHACAVEKLSLSIVAETNALSVQRSLVLGGLGWTVLPPLAVAEDLKNGILSGAPFAGGGIRRAIGLALPAQRPIPRHVQHAVVVLESCVKDALHRGDWPEARWIAE